jgi:hypothetical protein
MRRLALTASVAIVALTMVAPSALARHHDRHHHKRHHRHARIERFGQDVTSTPASADNAGTVKSFENGVLTLTLGDGSTVSGAVTSDTELECAAQEEDQTMHADGDTSGGDNQGDDQGEDENGAQNDDQGEDQNDDEAQNNCSTANLTSGTIVDEAELRISGAGSVWEKLELGS